MVLERKVKADIKEYLRSIGAYYFMPVQTGYGATTVDFLVCYKGKFFAIEAKRPGIKEATPLQEAMLKIIRTAGGIAFMANDVEMVKREIEQATATGLPSN